MSKSTHQYVGPHFQEVLERARINDSFSFCATIDEAAKILNVSSRAVRRFVAAGVLPVVNMSQLSDDYRILRITIDDLSRFIADRRILWIEGKPCRISDGLVKRSLASYNKLLADTEFETAVNVEEAAKHDL